MDYNSNERIGSLSGLISWLLCAFPVICAGVVAVNLFLFTLNPLPLPFVSQQIIIPTYCNFTAD